MNPFPMNPFRKRTKHDEKRGAHWGWMHGISCLASISSPTPTPRYLDELLDNSLLRKPDVPRKIQAAQEGARLKKLLGSLRYLYRNSSPTYWFKGQAFTLKPLLDTCTCTCFYRPINVTHCPAFLCSIVLICTHAHTHTHEYS